MNTYIPEFIVEKTISINDGIQFMLELLEDRSVSKAVVKYNDSAVRRCFIDDILNIKNDRSYKLFKFAHNLAYEVDHVVLYMEYANESYFNCKLHLSNWRGTMKKWDDFPVKDFTLYKGFINLSELKISDSSISKNS